MNRGASQVRSVAGIWRLARSGDLRGAADAARKALRSVREGKAPKRSVELLLVRAFSAMRQGDHGDALRELDAARIACRGNAGLALRVEAWRAELAYFQGRYSEANAIIGRVLEHLEQEGDWAYVAFSLRTRIAILLARVDYDAIEALRDRAIRAAEQSGDSYVMVQVLNILGAVHFDRATSKLGVPHARAHLSSLDLDDVAPMEADARQALRFFERARTVAEAAHYEFAAWYVAGNIERLEILLGHADRAVRAIRKRLGILQAHGARYDEIVTRSNLAWGLRTLGRYDEALHELDVALRVARATGTYNVLLEFLEYDRSIVLGALGDTAGAHAGYRRYLQLVGAAKAAAQGSAAIEHPAAPKPPLEPFFLKRADRFIAEHLHQPFTVVDLARHCRVGLRTLQQAFIRFRGLTAVAHARNLRLDGARRALTEERANVTEIASRYAFRSPTTFALEYRKRFGTAPSQAKRAARGGRA